MHEGQRAEDREGAEDKPDVHELERSIAEHRRDLAEHVHELGTAVRAKLDMKSHVRHAARVAELGALRVVDHLVAHPGRYLVIGGALLLLLLRRGARVHVS